MMDVDEIALLRLNTLAQMAATLEAGDRACQRPEDGVSPVGHPAQYAKDALKLYKAVEDLEFPALAAAPEPTQE